MGRRLKGEERRRVIIEAAPTLFSQKGFRGTTTKEIAQAAGCSEATLFKHFATKDALYSAILETKVRIEEVHPLVYGASVMYFDTVSRQRYMIVSAL
jgi:AcrR family transcriptional regulator